MSNVYGRVNSGFNSVLCKSAAEVAFKYAANVSDLPSSVQKKAGSSLIVALR